MGWDGAGQVWVGVMGTFSLRQLDGICTARSILSEGRAVVRSRYEPTSCTLAGASNERRTLALCGRKHARCGCETVGLADIVADCSQLSSAGSREHSTARISFSVPSSALFAAPNGGVTSAMSSAVCSLKRLDLNNCSVCCMPDSSSCVGTSSFRFFALCLKRAAITRPTGGPPKCTS